MFVPILATKLHIPSPRLKVILRSRLVERLNEGLSGKLTLISAPAGFGKTTLISEWLAGCGRPAAWLSLDEGDNHPARFLAYLVAALQTISAHIGEGVLAAVQAPQPHIELLLTTLLNEISAMPDPFILVLDDYHVINARQVDEALTFLVAYLPRQLHLVIASREDPPLPLARLRARGHLNELRAADLRFTPAEAAEFLNQVMDQDLSLEDIAAVDKRTEGWIAGLQLASIALQAHLTIKGRSETASFIQAFTGSHRFVLDYLIEEVLQEQPEEIRTFLLQTSVLDLLCSSLCDAVTGQNDSKSLIVALERSNLFVIPLDNQRQWYRYHHLFADVLRTRLLEEQPGQVPVLHKRASAWYEQNGMPQDAIRHALAGEDFERAASLLEIAWSAMDISYQSAVWLGWVKLLPDQVLHARPVLNVGYAWALLDAGEMENCEAHLLNAERWLENPAKESVAGDKMIVVDQELFLSLPATIATARAYRSLAIGDVPGAVRYASRALDLTPEGDQLRRNQGTALLGLAQYAGGDLEAACQSYTEFQASLNQSGDIATATGITFVLADIKLAQGRLREAIHAYQQELQQISGKGDAAPVGTSELYRGLGELYCERGDLEAAADHLRTAKKLGEQVALTDWQHRLYEAEARLQEAQGNLDEAHHLLDEAQRWYVRSPLPNVRPIAALRARVWIRQGKLPEALDWVRDQGLHSEDAISYQREFEYITLARLLIARYKIDRFDDTFQEAMRLLERLLKAAEDGGRMGSLIEILILESLLHQAEGNITLALAPLKRALALAEPEGYVQLFASEGKPMAELLTRLKDDRYRVAYVDTLRAAIGQQLDNQPLAQNTAPPILQPLVEPLSERELEVLRLLRTDLSGPEIARELVVSLNTLRTHTKNIFSKLGVNDRRTAVRRAEELGLF